MRIFCPAPAIFLLQPPPRLCISRLTQGRGRSSGVEHYLAKVRVESSNLFARSIFLKSSNTGIPGRAVGAGVAAWPFRTGAARSIEHPRNSGGPMRNARITRKTAETDIAVEIALDGSGHYDNRTGVGFFDHMLDQLARHALIDMTVSCEGDLHIDDHHTVEDVGIALGQALSHAIGDKRGIRRYGACLLPMDDALVRAALDLSGRPYLVWNMALPTDKIGTFDTELVREFFQAFSTHGGITLHLEALAGINSHHMAEAAFKAVGRALREALESDPRKSDAIPSTKGSL